MQQHSVELREKCLGMCMRYFITKRLFCEIEQNDTEEKPLGEDMDIVNLRVVVLGRLGRWCELSRRYGVKKEERQGSELQKLWYYHS